MITSRQNEQVKAARALFDKKSRDREGLFLAEGVKTAAEALSFGGVKCIFGTEKGLNALENAADLKGETVYAVTESVFESLSGEVSPQGVVAVVKKPAESFTLPQGNSVFLDGVADPANVGAVIRTAAAAGYNDLYLAACADAYSPKSVRASMGGIFRVRIHTGEREALASLVNVPFYAADMRGENVFTFVPAKKFCLVIGSEAHGVSDRMRALSQKCVSVPMEGGMESLNAAVAAGIIMYALKHDSLS